MFTSKKLFFFLITIFFIFQAIVFCFSEQDEAWVYLELGKREFYYREYGQALRHFRNGLEIKSIYPEVQFWIGKTYAAEGAWQAAIEKYQLALSQADSFRIHEQHYAVRYALSEIYYSIQKFKSFEETLVPVIEANQEILDLSTPIRIVLHTKGLDRVIKLYRFQIDYALQAFLDLGSYYALTGRYSRSSSFLIVATIIQFTTILDYFMDKDPEYEYETYLEFLNDCSQDDSVVQYIHNSGFFRSLYYLALSLWWEGSRDVPKTIWQGIAQFPLEIEYKTRSLRQLQVPYKEMLQDFTHP